MPEFREADGLPDYQRAEPNSQRSRAELAAVKGKPEETARSRVTGGGDMTDRTPPGPRCGGD